MALNNFKSSEKLALLIEKIHSHQKGIFSTIKFVSFFF
jgi:hypothetical protein